MLTIDTILDPMTAQARAERAAVAVCDLALEIIDRKIAEATKPPETLDELKALIRARRQRWPRLAASIGPGLTSTYAAGYLHIKGDGRNTWTATGAPWLFGVIAAAKARRGSSGEGRVLGRLLNGHYKAARVVRVSRETCDEQRRREHREDPGSADMFAAALGQMKARKA